MSNIVTIVPDAMLETKLLYQRLKSFQLAWKTGDKLHCSFCEDVKKSCKIGYFLESYCIDTCLSACRNLVIGFLTLKHLLSAATMVTTMEVVVEELWTRTVHSSPIITPQTGFRTNSLSWNTWPAAFPLQKQWWCRANGYSECLCTVYLSSVCI